MTEDANNADSARHPGQPTTWARLAAGLLEYAERSGAARADLLRESGLSEADFADLDARVPTGAVYSLIEAAAWATGDDYFGIGFAHTLEVADLDALGFLMLTSATLGQAFDRAMRYQRIWNDGERYVMHERGDTVSVTFTPHGPPRPAHRHVAEMAFYDMVVNGGRIVGRALDILHLRFRHCPPSPSPRHREFFAIDVEFDAPLDEVVFPRSVMAIELPEANEAMFAFFDRYAAEKLARLPDPPRLCDRVRATIENRLPGNFDLDLSKLAAELGMSSRTLQRRLRQQGHSMHALVEDVRRERALLFLGTSMAIAEIAYLLGYSEASAFHRAFKRWTGKTPESFRTRG